MATITQNNPNNSTKEVKKANFPTEGYEEYRLESSNVERIQQDSTLVTAKQAEETQAWVKFLAPSQDMVDLRQAVDTTPSSPETQINQQMEILRQIEQVSLTPAPEMINNSPENQFDTQKLTIGGVEKIDFNNTFSHAEVTSLQPQKENTALFQPGLVLDSLSNGATAAWKWIEAKTTIWDDLILKTILGRGEKTQPIEKDPQKAEAKAKQKKRNRIKFDFFSKIRSQDRQRSTEVDRKEKETVTNTNIWRKGINVLYRGIRDFSSGGVQRRVEIEVETQQKQAEEDKRKAEQTNSRGAGQGKKGPQTPATIQKQRQMSLNHQAENPSGITKRHG